MATKDKSFEARMADGAFFRDLVALREHLHDALFAYNLGDDCEKRGDAYERIEKAIEAEMKLIGWQKEKPCCKKCGGSGKER